MPGWQCFLEGMLIRWEDYLAPGRLVTSQSAAPDEEIFFEELTRAVDIPASVQAVFIWDVMPLTTSPNLQSPAERRMRCIHITSIFG
jgi:hypothetical protein